MVVLDVSPYDTLFDTINVLNAKGYTEDFKAVGAFIEAIYAKKKYNIDDVQIIQAYRFDSDTDPSEEVEVFVLETKDGTKGTLVIPYSANTSENADLIRALHK